MLQLMVVLWGKKTGQGTDSNWSTGEIQFYTAGTKQNGTSGKYMRNTPDFKIDSAGEIHIEGGRILSSGGIYLGGSNNNSNLLDDYEEGTWTPTFVGQGASIGSGTYIKIGRLVTLRAQATGDTNASSSGALYIGGLPFAVDGTTIRMVVSMDSVNASASGNNVASPFNGQMFYMYDQYIRAASTGSNPYYQYSLIQSGTKIYITGSFLTPP